MNVVLNLNVCDLLELLILHGVLYISGEKGEYVVNFIPTEETNPANPRFAFVIPEVPEGWGVAADGPDGETILTDIIDNPFVYGFGSSVGTYLVKTINDIQF